MLFSRQSEVKKVKIWTKSENLKIQDGKAACDVIYLTIVAMEINSTPRGFA